MQGLRENGVCMGMLHMTFDPEHRQRRGGANQGEVMTEHSEWRQSASVRVVDDDDSFRTSMTRLLRAAGLNAMGYRCAGEFLMADAVDLPGCILLDIAMPGPSGVDLLKALVSRKSAPPIIFVTGRDDVLTSVDVMKSGAVDYIVKPAGAERVLTSVRRAIEIDAQQRATRRELSELRTRFEQLTDVERAVFFGIVRNKLNKQLAAELGACERTIKAQRARMMEKLQISSLPELVRAARLLEGMNAEGSQNPEGQDHARNAFAKPAGVRASASFHTERPAQSDCKGAA
jgi:FixJ family two-component response regulator